ncbi:MAG: LLM class flavin-dependent oxidoreductase [bacterium]|nr:LLM class flavin-dependent oxidoreductase [bacterium]
MVRISSAPRLQQLDGLTSFERAVRQPLMLGLFLPHQQGAWTPSKASRTTSWTFDYNAELAVRADELGFDLVFALATWLGKGGYGGDIRFRENSIDPFITSAALAPLTHNVLLISTVHILYGWHPLHIAKYGAVIDHISAGRWGLNVVTGYQRREPLMFGLTQFPHDQRYALAEEFTTMMKRLWTEDENLDFTGKWYKTEGAFVAPKPVNGLPVLVSAGSSRSGMDYATSHANLIFATAPTGADPGKACISLPQRLTHIKSQAREKGREVKVLVNPHVICRPTEAEARAWYKHIRDARDETALDNFFNAFRQGDQSSWRQHNALDWAVGGNLHLVGTPEMIVDWFIRLRRAGVDGMQINFFDFAPDLDYFATAVLPLMQQAGLRLPFPPAGKETLQ